MPQVQNLWPDVLPEEGQTPFNLLRDLASGLQAKYRSLRGRVRRQIDEYYVRLSFVIVTPDLGDYEYELFEVHHNVIELYPVVVDASPIDKRSDFESTRRKLESEAALVEWLSAVLADPKTKKIIQTLLAQSSDVRRDYPSNGHSVNLE
jgi:hypothetical protein